MLTADLVTARRRGDELRLIPVDPRRRARIETLAAAFSDIARAQIGSTRQQLDDALDEGAAGADLPSPDRRLIAAVQKLVYDGCSFEEPDAETAAALRREIFRRAAAERRAASPGAPFDRGALLEAAARERGTTAADVEAGCTGIGRRGSGCSRSPAAHRACSPPASSSPRRRRCCCARRA